MSRCPEIDLFFQQIQLIPLWQAENDQMINFTFNLLLSQEMMGFCWGNFFISWWCGEGGIILGQTCGGTPSPSSENPVQFNKSQSSSHMGHFHNSISLFMKPCFILYKTKLILINFKLIQLQDYVHRIGFHKETQAEEFQLEIITFFIACVVSHVIPVTQ